MENFELFALGGMKHSSPAMFERRRRILQEARRMISERGIDSFSIGELCQRAEVAQRTIYNAFGSRETVIAYAIRQYFSDFERRAEFATSPGTVEGIVDRLVTATIRNQANLNYIFAMTSLYFTATVDPRVRELLLDVGKGIFGKALVQLQLAHQLEEHVEPRRLLVDLANLRAAHVQEWANRSLDEHEYLKVTLKSTLVMLAGATRGDARSEIREWIAAFESATPRARQFLAEARQRVSTLDAQDPLEATRAAKPKRKKRLR